MSFHSAPIRRPCSPRAPSPTSRRSAAAIGALRPRARREAVAIALGCSTTRESETTRNGRQPDTAPLLLAPPSLGGGGGGGLAPAKVSQTVYQQLSRCAGCGNPPGASPGHVEIEFSACNFRAATSRSSCLTHVRKPLRAGLPQLASGHQRRPAFTQTSAQQPPSFVGLATLVTVAREAA